MIYEGTFFGIPLVKYLEGVLAAYTFAVGMLFIVDGHALDAPVYDHWQGLGAIGWGSLLVCIALMHVFALWLNGRTRVASRVMRACANVSHLYVSLQFVVFFLAGQAPWGALTFGVLMIGLILPILATTLHQARSAVDGY